MSSTYSNFRIESSTGMGFFNQEFHFDGTLLFGRPLDLDSIVMRDLISDLIAN